MELLPAIDILDGKVVRLAKGDYDQVTVYNNDPVDQARKFERQGATWVHVVDLDGARSGVPTNSRIIERIVSETRMKVEVGGGVRTMDTLQRYCDIGVQRVVLGTSLVTDRTFAEEAFSRFGSMLTAGIDAKGGEVAVEGWREGAGVPAESLVDEVRSIGFQHLVYTDISRDGMQTGVDPATYEHISTVFARPVIASGGVSGMADLQALSSVADSIEGVIAGRAVYEGTLDVERAVKFCQEATKAALEQLL